MPRNNIRCNTSSQPVRPRRNFAPFYAMPVDSIDNPAHYWAELPWIADIMSEIQRFLPAADATNLHSLNRRAESRVRIYQREWHPQLPEPFSENYLHALRQLMSSFERDWSALCLINESLLEMSQIMLHTILERMNIFFSFNPGLDELCDQAWHWGNKILAYHVKDYSTICVHYNKANLGLAIGMPMLHWRWNISEFYFNLLSYCPTMREEATSYLWHNAIVFELQCLVGGMVQQAGAYPRGEIWQKEAILPVSFLPDWCANTANMSKQAKLCRFTNNHCVLSSFFRNGRQRLARLFRYRVSCQDMRYFCVQYLDNYQTHSMELHQFIVSLQKDLLNETLTWQQLLHLLNEGYNFCENKCTSNYMPTWFLSYYDEWKSLAQLIHDCLVLVTHKAEVWFANHGK